MPRSALQVVTVAASTPTLLRPPARQGHAGGRPWSGSLQSRQLTGSMTRAPIEPGGIVSLWSRCAGTDRWSSPVEVLVGR